MFGRWGIGTLFVHAIPSKAPPPVKAPPPTDTPRKNRNATPELAYAVKSPVMSAPSPTRTVPAHTCAVAEDSSAR